MSLATNSVHASVDLDLPFIDFRFLQGIANLRLGYGSFDNVRS